MSLTDIESTARDYYNSDDAESFYSTVWGGEDIHIGIYHGDTEPIFDASRRTVELIDSQIINAGSEMKALDIGAGYGGSARYLAKKYGCRVECLNLSEIQNKRNRELNKEQQLDNLIAVTDGSFENLPYGDGSFNLIWSQDAILHSGNRIRVVKEAVRVLENEGEIIFTDIMQADDCPDGVLQPILERIHLSSLASPKFYRDAFADSGLEEVGFFEQSDQLSKHYSRVLEEITKKEDDIARVCSREYIERMKIGLQHWIDGGLKGYLKWGIFHFKR